jgi:catecholate siderophore receptor
MSRYTGRGAQHLIQKHAGFVSIAALLCLSGTAKLAAQAPDSSAPAQQAPASPQTATPSASENKDSTSSGAPAAQTGGSVSLPTVSVDTTRRRRPRRRATHAPTPAPVAPVPAPVVPAAAPAATNGFQAFQSGITRLPVPLRDTPQTINVVTPKRIEEQRITSMEEALRTVPGITFSAGEGGQQGDSPIIRGFTARGDIFRDGLRDPGWYTRDLFSADRVEVYKGPSAFAFGRGSTGGAINIVSKLPNGVPYVDSTFTGTSVGGYRVDLDASGRKDNISGRIAAMYQDYPTPDRDHVFTRRWGVAPSFKIDFNPETRATLSYIYQGEEGIPDYGWPYLPQPVHDPATNALTNPGYFGNGSPTTPVPIPRHNWFGVASGPLADLVTTDTHIVTAKFERDLAPDLKITNATRYISVDRFARVTSPRDLGQAGNAITPPPGYPVWLMTIGREHFQVETDNTLLVNQTDLTGKMYTGPLKHTFSAGLELARETRDQQRAMGMTSRQLCDPADPLCRTNIYNPIDTSFGGIFTGWNPPVSTESNTVAAYAFDQVKVSEYLELLGSLRFDHFSTDYTDFSQPPATRNLTRVDDMLSWRVGAVLHPTKNSSVYVAHGISYNPAAEFGTLSSSPTNAASALLDPEKNKITEVGAKADFLANRLSVTGSVFRIEKTNLRIPADPVTNTVLVLDGLARVDGVEVGVAGRLTDQWQVSAGYSFLDSEIVETTRLSELGRELPNTPHHNFTFWSSYDVTPRFTVGGGAVYQSDAFVNTTNTAFVPAYWRFDAMASYKVTPNSTLQLNIYNLTDEFYFAQYYQGHAVPASGRYASLSYRIRFQPPKPVSEIVTK